MITYTELTGHIWLDTDDGHVYMMVKEYSEYDADNFLVQNVPKQASMFFSPIDSQGQHRSMLNGVMIDGAISARPPSEVEKQIISKKEFFKKRLNGEIK